ncbi:MAG: hypothetical protein P8J27_06485 [Mariniblastus sp.]|nr:hypothetical protein [Mariniblastus sp.]
MTETEIENLLLGQDDDGFVDPEIILQQLLENPNLSQHVTRSVESNRETLVGYFRVAFEPNQQRQVLHIPFAPPMKVVPQVDAHVTDHDHVRVRITDCQKFGIRAEIILGQASGTATKLLVEIIASEPF